MPYIGPADELAYLRWEAAEAMSDPRTALQEFANLDDDTLDALTDDEVTDLLREFCEYERPADYLRPAHGKELPTLDTLPHPAEGYPF